MTTPVPSFSPATAHESNGVSDDFLGQLVKGLLLLGVGIGGGVAVGKRGEPAKSRIINNPLVVQAADQFASKAELKDLQRKLEHLERRLTDTQREILAAGEDRAIAIHKRLDRQSEQLHEVIGEMKHICSAVQAVSFKK